MKTPVPGSVLSSPIEKSESPTVPTPQQISVPLSEPFARLLSASNQKVQLSEENLRAKYPYAYHQTPTMIKHVFANNYGLKMCAAWNPTKGGPGKYDQFRQWVLAEIKNRNNLLLRIAPETDIKAAEEIVVETRGTRFSNYTVDTNHHIQLKNINKNHSRVESAKLTDNVHKGLFEKVASYHKKLTELREELDYTQGLYGKASSVISEAPKGSAAAKEAGEFYGDVQRQISEFENKLSGYMNHSAAMLEKYKSNLNQMSRLETASDRSVKKDKKKNEKRKRNTSDKHVSKKRATSKTYTQSTTMDKFVTPLSKPQDKIPVVEIPAERESPMPEGEIPVVTIDGSLTPERSTSGGDVPPCHYYWL